MTLTTATGAELDPASFRAIADLAYRESGLTLVAEKSSMVRSRLRHRLRDLGLQDFAAYTALLQSDEGRDERRHLISALTTNVSHFFREKHHFDALTGEIERKLQSCPAGGELLIWSAGCSNGQEALSIAMTLLETVPQIADVNVRILATDIDPEVVSFARKGLYPERLMGGVPDTLLSRYFDRQDTGQEAQYAPRPELRRMIRYNVLNLLGPWPMTRQFDAIFCRNVVIYFDVPTQTNLWPRIRQVLKPDGVLYLGHSERIADPAACGFHCTGPTTYRPTGS